MQNSKVTFWSLKTSKWSVKGTFFRYQFGMKKVHKFGTQALLFWLILLLLKSRFLRLKDLKKWYKRYLFKVPFCEKKGTFLGQKVLFRRFCYQKGTFFGQKATFLIWFLTKKVRLIFRKGTDSDVLNFWRDSYMLSYSHNFRQNSCGFNLSSSFSKSHCWDDFFKKGPGDTY